MRAPAYQNHNVTVYIGDCLNVLPELAECSVDSVVTDPPYGLEFMGKEWDGPKGWRTETDADLAYIDNNQGTLTARRRKAPEGYRAGRPFQDWCQQWAVECLRVLKPGGHLLAFGGTRTWHRLAVAIEDAGFEIRDSIAWLYGSGFPKSLDVSKAIDKAAGARREVVGTTRKGMIPGKSTFVGNYKPAGLPDIREPADITAPATDTAKQWSGWGTALKPAHEPIIVARKPIQGTVAANVQQHGTGALNIDATRVGGGGQLKWSTLRDMGYHGGSDSSGTATENTAGRWPTNVILDPDAADELDKQSEGQRAARSGGGHARHNNRSNPTAMSGPLNASTTHGFDDEGGASRFFPTFRYNPKAPGTERPTADGTTHPTVKPLDLMRWLIRLVTPPHGLVLDPFAGSGTTAEACIHEHMRCTTIERETDYLPIITARLHKPMQVGFDYDIGELDT